MDPPEEGVVEPGEEQGVKAMLGVGEIWIRDELLAGFGERLLGQFGCLILIPHGP